MAKNDTEKKGLKPCQYRAITALVATSDAAAAAKAAGVSLRTVRRWMTTAAFNEEVANAESELVRGAARRLGHLADKALGVLESVMNDKDAADSPRIRAATAVLDTCLRWRAQVSLEERLSALEKQVQ